MRTTVKLDVAVSEDADGLLPLHGPKDASKLARVTDTFRDEAHSRLRIAGGATVTLPLAEVTNVRGIWIECQADFNVILTTSGGASPVLQAKRAQTVAGVVDASATCSFYADFANLTQVQVVNPDATNVLEGKYLLVGDPP